MFNGASFDNEYCKVLWNGTFNSGSITIPNGAKYSLFAVKTTTGITVIGNSSYGLGGFMEYGSLTPHVVSYRFSASFSGNDLIWTIDSLNKGVGDSSGAGTVAQIIGIKAL